MTYLDDILAETKATQSRSNGMQNLLRALSAPRPQAETPVSTPDSSGAVPHGSFAPSATGFNPAFQAALDKMLAASHGQLRINSGFRSPERQAQLYQAAVQKYGSEVAARKWVAPPGHSNHNRGLAADLGFTNAAAIAWAHANAAKYGLNFPLSNENWHIEPIGIR